MASPKRAAAAAPGCWISTLVEADSMVTQQGLDCMTDWRIVARAPLVLDNQLPVSAQYALWERQAARGPLVLRQQGSLAGGQRLAVYSADMRHQVSEWALPGGLLPGAPKGPGGGGGRGRELQHALYTGVVVELGKSGQFRATVQLLARWLEPV